MHKATNQIDIGKRFGRLTVIAKAAGHYRWLCRCDCGTESVVYHYGLLNGHTQSCGCMRYDGKPSLQNEIAGLRSGALVALSPTGDRNAAGCILWRCKCDCGQFTIVTATSFANSKVRSCGCQQFNGSRLPDGVAAFNRLFERYRRHALKANREFSLTRPQFHAITQRNCAYCGQPPSRQEHYYERSYNTGAFFGNGIDRVNNADGYTAANSVACCEVCNRAKRALPLDKFQGWLCHAMSHVLDSEWEKVAFIGGC